MRRALVAVPKRWHVYVVDLEPRVRSKPGRQRPCVAIQPTELGEAGLPSAVALQLTSKLSSTDAFALRVRIPAGTCRLTKERDVLVDQTLAWDNSLFGADLGPLPEALQEEIRRALLDFLDLAP